ncbi:hypothetical protein AD940_12430 [Gluconobacter thailandicus]|nr:hypothetical protein AD940_12430 [Gluconobacter thailandicus]
MLFSVFRQLSDRLFLTIFLILLADEATFGQLFPRYFDILSWTEHFHSAQTPIIFRPFHDFE